MAWFHLMQLLPAQLKYGCSYVRITTTNAFLLQRVASFPVAVTIEVAVTLFE